jgi:phosphatidylserine/phosphatidylglycerophosphate/cardiolipin synthase-like enzyme
MRAKASKDGLTLRVIAGSNNALLAFDLNETKRDGCLGFTIERTDLDTGARRWLPNMLRFPADIVDPSELKPIGGPNGKGTQEYEVPSVSTARAPLQKFCWGDYTLDPGKRYGYRVIARYGDPDEIVREGRDAEDRHAFDSIPGGVSVEIKTENNGTPAAAVFFNRGAAASKAYNDRYGDNDPDNIPDAKWWLSRGLEEALVAFIGHASDLSYTIHAAVYEFQKDDLLRALMQAKHRGVDVKVVYHARCKTSKKAKGKTAAKAGKASKPSKAKAAKKKANGKYTLAKYAADLTAQKNEDAIKACGMTFAKPRKANPQNAIMHNKFVVLLQKQAKGPAVPVAVWTGSTNWTDGAIYGQLNVGHAVYDPAIAAAYDKYFQLLYADSDAKAMRKGTVALSQLPAKRADVRHGVTPVFSPQPVLDMIELYADICRTGKVVLVSAPFALHPLITATFDKRAPGTLRFLMADKEGSFGKKGMVSLLENDRGNEVSVATTLKHALHDYQGRMLEDKESFHHAGVHIHSKIIASDPFGEDPVLVTGSANFSNNSTKTNDENSLIVRGDTTVMDIYATEFMRMFEHYWFRAHMQGQTPSGKKKGKPKGQSKEAVAQRAMGLATDSSWTDPYYKAGDQKMLERLIFVGAD